MILKAKFQAFNINKDVDIGNINENICDINDTEFFFDSRKK